VRQGYTLAIRVSHADSRIAEFSIAMSRSKPDVDSGIPQPTVC
jgi:hypothetical protein